VTACSFPDFSLELQRLAEGLDPASDRRAPLSRDVRIGGEVRKGYLAGDLHDPWKRYVFSTRQDAQQALQALQQESSTKSAENRPQETPVEDVAPFPDGKEDHYSFEERSAILEYDGGLTREEANARAAEEMPDLPECLDRRASKDQHIRDKIKEAAD
jgi:hypothetical protein